MCADENTAACRLEAIRSTLPDGVELVAVSKFHPVGKLREVYEAGQRCFGESRVAELIEKRAQMPDDVRWHFIGHVQTNKARKLIGQTDLIESIDSERLLELIDDLSVRAGVVTRVLMQVHVAAEQTKTGFSPDELMAYFADYRYRSLRATHLCGLMAMATNTDDMERVKADFEAAAELKRRIESMCPDLVGFDILSMGMSDDYPLAVACGSNMVRVGSAIFGPREY